MALACNIDVEEQEMVESSDDRDDDKDSENTEDWVDEREAMTVEQLVTLNKSVQPVRLMLIKVCSTFAIIVTFCFTISPCVVSLL